MQFFSDKIFKLWNACEIRVLVLLSLSLQIVLVIFGSRRKHIARKWIEILVWLAYLSADMVAVVSLGNIAKNQRDSGDTSENSNNFIQAFWAPCLLLHLGGPDTITAFSLEDNELWLRHLLGLGVQVGVAFYVFVKSWGNNPFIFLAIPIFVAGIIKYGERNWVLKSSSTEHIRKSLLSVRFTVYSLLLAPFGSIITKPSTTGPPPDPFSYVPAVRFVLDRANQTFLHYPFVLFKISTYLFQDHIVDSRCYLLSGKILEDKSREQTFEMIETELSFMYDMLYTKASLVYSRVGIFLRSISFVSCLSVLAAFSIHVHTQPHSSSVADIIITLLLLVGAVILEVYSFILFLRSDWTKLWLIKQDVRSSKRWSRSMGQYSIINSCFKQKAVEHRAVGRITEIFGIDEYWKAGWSDVSDDLKQCIFERIRGTLGEMRSTSETGFLKKVLDRRGEAALERNPDIGATMKWSTIPLPLDYSVILWHVATDICFFNDRNILGSSVNNLYLQTSKWLSDYMMFLYVLRPSMCPKGIREFSYRYKDVREEIHKFIDEKKHEKEIFNALLASNQDELQRMKVLGGATALAQRLNQIRDVERKWKMITEVWVEMLMHVAGHCEWKEHAQQLSKGGELITHVRLIMAHIGLTEQYHQFDV